MQLNILFLDIDGVLNPRNTRHPHVFAPDCVVQLRRILDARPETHVVFSTTWRTGLPFFVLGWLWHQHGLPLKRVLGRTPDIQHDRRGDEIRKWLDDASRSAPQHQIRSYAVVDDEAEPILETIPSQAVFACDPRHGLNEDVANRVIRHFQVQQASSQQP